MGYFYKDANGNTRYVPDGEQYKDDDSKSFTDKKGNKTVFKKAQPKKFMDKLTESKKELKRESAWRVDDTGHSEEDYANDQLWVTDKGSTLAITPDGDIISVCSVGHQGRMLIEFAVANGGKKLDSYDGNFGFYTKMGFEPVSWCKFNPKFAPHDWDPSHDRKEPIVFFKYTGKINAIDRHTFYSQVRPSSTYDQAMKKRDEEME